MLFEKNMEMIFNVIFKIFYIIAIIFLIVVLNTSIVWILLLIAMNAIDI